MLNDYDSYYEISYKTSCTTLRKGVNMSCTCQDCGNKYKVDFSIPDELWYRITPSVHKDSGLLCGQCIVKRIESLGNYDIYYITRNDPTTAKGQNNK